MLLGLCQGQESSPAHVPLCEGANATVSTPAWNSWAGESPDAELPCAVLRRAGKALGRGASAQAPAEDVQTAASDHDFEDAPPGPWRQKGSAAGAPPRVCLHFEQIAALKRCRHKPLCR